MNKIYYIYHIPTFVHPNGKIGKIGCSEEPEIRVPKQGYQDYEILEEHTCIYEASRREQELQKEYGYPVDISPYWNSRQHWGSNAGKIGGRSKSKIKLEKLKQNRVTWAVTSKYRDPLKVKENAKNNGGTHKHRDCVYCGRTINLMNIGRHENICKLK